MTAAPTFIPSSSGPWMDSPDAALLGKRELASASGAGIVGLADAGLFFAGDTVEEALAELGAVFDPATQTVLVAGALSITTMLSIIDGASGSYAVTLAAPGAGSIGRRKLIRKTSGNTITLALTNVVGMIDALGAPVSTTATFTTAEQALNLESNGTKWVVTGSSAVGT